MATNDKMQVGDKVNVGVSGPTPKPIVEISCEKCQVGHLCNACAELVKRKVDK